MEQINLSQKLIHIRIEANRYRELLRLAVRIEAILPCLTPNQQNDIANRLNGDYNSLLAYVRSIEKEIASLYQQKTKTMENK